MRIGIIGLGVIGGSIAKALKKVHAQNSFIIGFDPETDYTQAALADHTIDQIAPNADIAFSGCNVIFICTPVAHTVTVIKQLLPYVSADCILTDIGSTKYEVVAQVNQLLADQPQKLYFVGGHPMAGSEKSGYMASTDYLFENAYYILTPSSDTPDFILFILQKLIERLGAIPIILAPSYHDFAVATVSHLPHIIASGLVHLVQESDGDSHYLHTLAAGGFKDITRIASSNPTIWQSICLTNKNHLKKVYGHYLTILERFYTALDQEDAAAIYDFFAEGKSYRDTFKDGIQSDVRKTFTLYVDAKDEPGMIASIATLLSAHSINIKDIGVRNHREFEGGVLRISFATRKDKLQAAQLLDKHNYPTYS